MATRRRGPQPLTESELDELDRFLMSSATPEDAMDLEELDGYLTGLACGPQPVPSPDWLWPVWGDTEDGRRPVRFDSGPHCRHLLELVERHWSTLARSLQRGTAPMPVLFDYRHPGAGAAAPPLPGSVWSSGFMRAIGLQAESWQPAFEDDEASEALTPIVTLAHADDPEIVAQSPTPRQAEALVDTLPDAVLALFGFWRTREASPEASTRGAARVPRIGASDPCACGSTRRFSACCGRSSALN
jgi:uncharacterized protein